jgi:hypothetical protein
VPFLPVKLLPETIREIARVVRDVGLRLIERLRFVAQKIIELRERRVRAFEAFNQKD